VAGRYIRESVWRIWKNYKYKLNKKTKMKERKLMVEFRKYRREREMENISQSEIDFYNEMVRQFERAFINLENLTANNLKIINYLNEEYIFKDGLTDHAQSLLHP
jgi:CRISPR/Cas system-associated protein Cas5 (RAMP superfamily)